MAEAALETGASIVNDISAGRVDPRMLALVARRGAGFIAMHSRGSPRHMQENPAYDDVVSEVVEHLRERVRAALEAGVDLAKIWIDPGIGFGTALEHNLELLARLAEMRSLGLPVCVGVSRKSFISAVEGRTGAQLASADTEQRVGGTAAAIAVAVWNGAEILRVHDVRTMAQAARVAWACRTSLAPSEMNRTTPRSCPSRDEAHNQD